MALSEADLHWMRRALLLSKRGFPVPNPHVGAVVVKNGVPRGEGYHPYAGAAHAEIFALQQAGDAAAGATLYVTLEPCCHYGRTPPCTHALIERQIARVVVGTLDPNPEVAGKGIHQLRQAGLQVELLSPDNPAEARLITQLEAINRIYFFWHRHHRPFITLKAALSLDGKIATHTGDSKWITSERARRAAHRLRAEHAAVLVGIRTVLKDQPHLTARIKGVVNQPLRVVLDSKLRIADLARETSDTRLLPPLLQEGNNTLVFALSADEEPVRAKIKYLESLGVQVICLAPDPKQPSRVPVRKVVELLAERGVCSVLVEGGGQVAASFLEARLANRIAYFYAPKLIGGADAPTALEGSGIMRVADAPRITNLHIRKLGDDWLVEGDIEYR